MALECFRATDNSIQRKFFTVFFQIRKKPTFQNQSHSMSGFIKILKSHHNWSGARSYLPPSNFENPHTNNVLSGDLEVIVFSEGPTIKNWIVNHIRKVQNNYMVKSQSWIPHVFWDIYKKILSRPLDHDFCEPRLKKFKLLSIFKRLKTVWS